MKIKLHFKKKVNKTLITFKKFLNKDLVWYTNFFCVHKLGLCGNLIYELIKLVSQKLYMSLK